MATAADRGWGDPTSSDYRKQHIVTIDAGGVRLNVRREAAPLFMGFIVNIVARGYDLSGRADDWGWACRPIRGYEDEWERTHNFKYLSNHSWGLALDLNSQDHPLGRRGTGVPRFVVDEAHHWGLSWGGDYTNRPDEMHFECLLTPAQVADLVCELSPGHTKGDALMRDERIVVIPDPDSEGRQLIGNDEHGIPLGVASKTSSVDLLASRDGHHTDLWVQWFVSDGPTWKDLLALTVANRDGTPATPGRKARIVIEHR